MKLTPALFVSIWLAGAATAVTQDRRGLEDVFAPGLLLEDRNGDGFVDFVNASLELGDATSPAVLAGAADVAARLGFETMAMDLPLTGSSSGTPVRFDARASDLSPGEGRLELDADGLRISGGDDEGLRRAARLLAGRLPFLWELDGATFETLFDDVAAALGSPPASATVPAMRVVEGHVALLALDVELETEELGAARAALEGVLGYPGVAEITVTLRGGGASESFRVRRELEPPGARPIPARPGGGPKRSLDLSSLFTPEGLLGDSDENLIADRVETVLSPAEPFRGTVDLAARLGLEAAGVSIPIVKLPEEIAEAESEPILTLIGEHPLIEEESDLGPGEGSIRVAPEAFGPSPALVVRGGDLAGVERALDQIAVRLPHVWERGKDRPTLDDVELDLWKFFSGRSPAGQAASALYKLDRLVEKLEGEDLRSARVLVSIEKPAPGLADVVRERAGRLSPAPIDVELDDRDVDNAATLFEESFEIDSEVAELRRLVERRLVPAVRRGAEDVVLEARLSEPLEVRRALEEELTAALAEQGAVDPEVRVLSAYKQGYSWLLEAVAPALEGRDVAELTVRFAEYRPPAEWPQQAIHTPVRWLHEAFPADEVLADELALPLERVRFEMASPDAPAYEAVALGADGVEIFRASFEPKVVLRPYLDRFRDYEMVNVTTGWVTARVGSERVVDQRIATDPERFWDHFQSETLARIYDYVMTLHEGNPRGDGKDAPYFGEVEVEVELSEPNERLDVDREIVSSMDALHEDVYFTTLTFFRLLGRNARGEELTFPGRVIPRMRPKSDGEAGSARIRFTGFRTSRPAVVVSYEKADGETGELRLDVPKVEIDRPSALGARVRAGAPGLTALEVRQKVHTERDERESLLERERAEDVDESILSAEQAAAMTANLEALRARGLYLPALAYPHLGALELTLAWEYRYDPEVERAVSLAANGRPGPAPDVTEFLEHVRPGDDALVQWETPIPPPEAYGLLARMAAHEEATVYRAGTSYLGKEIWAMDLMAPIEASHFSHDKATTLKPTIIYSARQHANEVSSTSHVLRFAEGLLTDPEERGKLDRVNVVIHPVTNPDGAQLAYDLYRENPDFILHAGYYASLGMDVTSGSTEPMPIYPEAKVRPDLWSTWRPDIFLNPHGYPSHQLVQLFSEYTGLVRRGRVTERNWSMNKGWFMPGFGYVDDPQFPRHKEAAFTIRDYITEAINSAPGVRAMNERSYDRYRRYGGVYDPEVFKLPMVDGVMIHTALKGDRAPSPGSDRGYNPRVTIWSGTTEAPDETAHGDWLELVATAGLAWDRAILDYLVDGDHQVERKSSAFFGGVSLSLDRPRPPKPPESEEAEGEEPSNP